MWEYIHGSVHREDGVVIINISHRAVAETGRSPYHHHLLLNVGMCAEHFFLAWSFVCMMVFSWLGGSCRCFEERPLWTLTVMGGGVTWPSGVCQVSRPRRGRAVYLPLHIDSAEWGVQFHLLEDVLRLETHVCLCRRVPLARTDAFLIRGLPRIPLHVIRKTSTCLYHLLIRHWARKAYLSHSGLVLLIPADKG